MIYDRVLEDLKDSLKRADLLQHWQHHAVYKVGDRLRVEFEASIAIRSSAHAKPAGVDFADARLESRLEFTNEGGLDAIKVCAAQVVVDGLMKSGEIARFALHFDRHDPSHESTDLHSRFHWQVGGERLEGQDFGSVLQLQGPRFPWHPIDPVLLVDFVLGHFHGAKRTQLMQAAGLQKYPKLLFAAQTLHVAPFFASLQQTLTSEKFTETPYWPALCGP